MLDASQTASYEIILVRLSVRLSVYPYVRLKIGSLFFSDIVHDNSWPWYLVTNAARFLKIKFGGPNLGPTRLNEDQTKIFRYFLEFGSLVFLEIGCSDSF